MASALVILVSVLVQLGIYLLILAYLWFCYPKTTFPAKRKLKSELVMIKRVRTNSEKIQTWMASAEFRTRPEHRDIELGAFHIGHSMTYPEALETPRLPGPLALERPRIASDGEEARPQEASLEEESISLTASLSQPDTMGRLSPSTP